MEKLRDAVASILNVEEVAFSQSSQFAAKIFHARVASIMNRAPQKSSF